MHERNVAVTASDYLQFGTMDFVGPFVETRIGNKCTFVLSDWY